METSINSGYQQLPEPVKRVVRLDANAAISFNTNKAIIIRLLAMFLSAITMFMLCLVLFSGELFHLIFLIVMVLGAFILFSHSNRIVVDPHQCVVLRQESWLWRSAKVVQQQDIEHTEVVMTRTGNKDGRRIEVLGQVLQFELASDAEALMTFLKQQFNVNTLEQISNWPNKTPWFPASDKGLHADHEAPGDAELPLSDDIVPLWSLRDKLMLLIPVLVFSFVAAVLPWVRSL
ncbi:hypothetical protein ACFOEK_19175 [Litoribrevibacter euphylliae]|uniref:DUF2244 domain-containing protein n=1 Tax=Litoribrevibacter euphylliae TaxID=1834034 RepID=A0ABV7HH26_9GAMM